MCTFHRFHLEILLSSKKQVNIQNDVIALKVQSHTQNLGIKLFITIFELKYIQRVYLRPTQNM